MGEFLGAWRLVGETGHMGAPLVIGGIADLVGLSPGDLSQLRVSACWPRGPLRSWFRKPLRIARPPKSLRAVP